MSEFLGGVEIPEITPSGTFPITSDYGYGRAHLPEVVVHRFGSGNAKIEQRFLLGTGAKRFTVRRAAMSDVHRLLLRDFWETRNGPYGSFTYNAPNDDGNGTTAFICRFANEPLSWEMLTDWISSAGVTLIEIPDAPPTYTLNDTLLRFPSAELNAALLSQVQQLIPLIKIQPLQSGYPAIFVSDRRLTVGAQLYQARLLDFDGIQQSLGNESDEARFTFGNADRVMRDLANDVDLYRASLEFSLFHVGTGIKLDLWKGDIVGWAFDAGPEFQVTAADGLYELNLPYPTRKISRSCWKQFNDGLGCPFLAEGALDLVHFPGADPATCDKGYETPNGCLAHGMKRFFGGVIVEPQGVRILDNSTGTWGFGRSPITSVSLVSESIYDQVVPEIYTDSDMPVNCKIAAGRPEGGYYVGMGIVGEGPLGSFGSGHKLDNQLNHSPGMGLRTVLGADPAGATDFFSLDQSGDQTGGDWRKVFSGNSTYKDNFAAGTAFVVIRRSDAKGLLLSRLNEHDMIAIVAQGLSGWVWTAPGVRAQQVLTNPIWIVVNMLLRAKGLRFADVTTAEQHFDVDAAIAAAAICNESITKLVGSGSETHFKFRGMLQEEKPLRDWLQEILMNCLGYYTFAFGKLKLGVRNNSSGLHAFTAGNVIFESLTLAPARPAFNHLTANFADEEFEFASNSVSLYDIDHAKLLGGSVSPLFLKSTMNLAGSSGKSQALRIVATRLREELGGISAAEWKASRMLSLNTTVLALALEVGMVCSVTHPDMPGGAGEFRAQRWRLNSDYSITVVGRTSTDSMYTLIGGPKPADVEADPVPAEPSRDYAVPPAPVMVFGTGNFPHDGTILLPKITFATPDNIAGIETVMIVVYFTDELNPVNNSLSAGINATQLTIPVVDGSLFQAEDIAIIAGDPGTPAEAVLIASVTGNTLNIETFGRGWHGTAGITHAGGRRVDKVAAAKITHFPFKPGFFQGVEKDKWLDRIILPGARVTSIHAAAANLFGQGPLAIFNLLNFDSDPGESNTQAGLRTNHGDAIIITQDGDLALGEYAGPPIIVPGHRAMRDAFATVRGAPTGAILQVDVKRNGVLWTRRPILDGATASEKTAGGGLDTSILLAGDQISFELTQNGTLTYVGADLAINIRF